MTRTVTRLFDTQAEAESAVRDLEDMGIPEDDLSIVAGRKSAEETRAFARADDGENDTAEGAGKGAATGGILGGGAGLLAGLGLLAIPGLGPVVAAGWLASTAVGAVVGATAGGATGGLLGALKDSGVTEGDAHVYAEGVRRGGTLVSARVEEADVSRVEDALRRQSGVDAVTRGSVYRQEGWTAFEEKGASTLGTGSSTPT
ncbi:MAG: general stress protein [Caulobacteraceae bacterium]